MNAVEELLARASAQVRPHSSRHGEITVCCPFCLERDKTEDTEYKLGINAELGLAHCYRCDFRCRTLGRLMRELSRVYGIAFSLAVAPTASLPKPAQQPAPPVAEITGYPEGYEKFRSDLTDEVENMARQYLTQRRITPLQILKNKLGFAGSGKYGYRIVFPVLHTDGEVYGYVCRTFSNATPKYLNSPGIKLLWNGQRKGSTAVECEGIFDALAVERAVSNRPGVVAVAALGSSITNTQLNQLMRYGDVLLLPDADAAGVKGCILRAKKYTEAGLKLRVAVPKVLDGRDPADLSNAEILASIDGALPWCQNTEYRLRALKEPAF
jgi:DNA primase